MCVCVRTYQSVCRLNFATIVVITVIIIIIIAIAIGVSFVNLFSLGRRRTALRSKQWIVHYLKLMWWIPSNHWHFTQIYFHYYFTHSSTIFPIFLFWLPLFCHPYLFFRFVFIPCHSVTTLSNFRGVRKRGDEHMNGNDRSTNEIDTHTHARTFKT